MSLSGASNNVTGDDNLALHELFGFADTFGAGANDLLSSSLLASPFAGPLEDLHGPDAINFDDFLAGTEGLPSPAQESTLSPAQVNLASPRTPSPSQAHLEFLAGAYAPYKSSDDDLEISPEDLQSMQEFIREISSPIQRTSHQVTSTTTFPHDSMAQDTVNMKAKRTPLNRTSRPTPRSTEKTATKVTMKQKATSRKTQHQRTISTISQTITSPVTPSRHRSIDELLALNFYSLNEQEKCRVMLPMLRSLDPKELETSLAELPCIQAKGDGHEVHVVKAIHDSPPTPDADAELAARLTTGIPPSPTPVRKTTHRPSITPETPHSQESIVNSIEPSMDHGATRQREALEKAASLQAQGRKR